MRVRAGLLGVRVCGCSEEVLSCPVPSGPSQTQPRFAVQTRDWQTQSRHTKCQALLPDAKIPAARRKPCAG